MVVDKNRKIVFIHIPKTGGTTIEIELGLREEKYYYRVENNKALHHWLWKDYRKLLKKNYKNYFKFAIVRNPYSRMISEYKWSKNNEDNNYHKKENFNDFLTFVEDIVKNKKYNDNLFFDHLIPQYKFIYDKKDRIRINQLFKFENFNEIKMFLKNRFKVKGIEIHNKSKEENIILTPNQKERIYNLYKRDFELFNYQK